MNDSTNTISSNKLAQLLAQAKAAKIALQKSNLLNQRLEINKPEDVIPPTNPILEGKGRTGELITYNSKQSEAINYAGAGKSMVLIGAAGTGKTTTQQGIVKALIDSNFSGIIQDRSHKYLQAETPGIVVISFTRRAVNNIRRFMSDDMKSNCITHHKLLEYEPVFFELTDPVTGEEKKTMRFEATRNLLRTLDRSIKTIIVEESSMYSVEMYEELMQCCPHDPQFIFLGDIQQLPPVFGSAILGYKMLELKTIELTEVYRQAFDSPIIKLAHRILSGKPITAKEFDEWKVENKLTIHSWKKKISADAALLTSANFFTKAIESNLYNPISDMILIPYNKAFGTDELNKHLADYLAKKSQRKVFEIISGFKKLYFSIGDKVLYDKEDAIIVDIKPNKVYFGTNPQTESEHLDYWGNMNAPSTTEHHIKEMTADQIDLMLSSMSSSDEDKTNEASHVITLKVDSGDSEEKEVKIHAVGDLNNLILSYALTVHKAQGSEWRKVFLVFHQSHATLISRELLYTAVTRAKEELYIICEPETFEKGIKSQRIKGNTLQEKALYFRGKIDKENRL